MNYRFFTTQDKDERLRSLHEDKRSLQKRIDRLKGKLDLALETRGVVLDEDVHSDFQTIMDEMTYTFLEAIRRIPFRAFFGNNIKRHSQEKGQKRKGFAGIP